jgi:NAD dependent epimerase/dehydratase
MEKGEKVMDLNVLVTGAGGFIGSHLVECLVRNGYRVKAFVHYNSSNNYYNLDKIPAEIRNEIEVIAGDIADSYVVDKAVKGMHMVFHLAALIGIPYSYVAPAAYVSANIVGTLSVLEACLRHKVRRVIHTSTSEVYGTAQYVPIDEKHPLVGQSPYSATKIAADQLSLSFWRSFELPVCVVRPFNTYGPRQSARAVIPAIITQALTRSKVKLGSLDPVRDLTFVEDTARGFLAAAESDKCIGEVINLGTGKGFSIGEVFGEIGRLLGKSLEVELDPVRVRPDKSEVMKLVSNNVKARELTGWEPSHTLTDGLLKTIDYIRAHISEYKEGLYIV